MIFHPSKEILKIYDYKDSTEKFTHTPSLYRFFKPLIGHTLEYKKIGVVDETEGTRFEIFQALRDTLQNPLKYLKHDCISFLALKVLKDPSLCLYVKRGYSVESEFHLKITKKDITEISIKEFNKYLKDFSKELLSL